VRYVALATDYDGTLAEDGRVSDQTVAAVEELRASGRRTIMVTGRLLEDLRAEFDHLELFDRVVAENGAVLFDPRAQQERVLGEPPGEEFVEALRDRGVDPLSVGRVIVATWEPHQDAVLDVIREHGLEMDIIFNKGAVMVLPPAINKASGLEACLADLRLSAHNVVGVGDAENDHAFLSVCEVAVAVANALPAVKERADVVTRGERGDGVRELIAMMLEDDLESVERGLDRHLVQIGFDREGSAIGVRPLRTNILVAGPSGTGKSNVTASFLEMLSSSAYQFCLIDPEGDYEGVEQGIVVGDPSHPPDEAHVLELLDDPSTSAVVNLLGIPLDDRPGFFELLLSRVQQLRSTTGRPHWVVLDEAHHMLPEAWHRTGFSLPHELRSLLMVTVHPDRVAPAALEAVDLVVATGDTPADVIEAFARASGIAGPKTIPQVDQDELLLWRREGDRAIPFAPIEPSGERRRHLRKYADGDVQEKAFVFRGPEDRLQLRAQNLSVFSQMADGIDDETWLHHLRGGDYERWFRDAIKDEDLAGAASEVRHEAAGPSKSRILEEIRQRYTLPA
jgi:HAD superfamily hydrolase (TIGR01484 family)